MNIYLVITIQVSFTLLKLCLELEKGCIFRLVLGSLPVWLGNALWLGHVVMKQPKLQMQIPQSANANA